MIYNGKEHMERFVRENHLGALSRSIDKIIDNDVGDYKEPHGCLTCLTVITSVRRYCDDCIKERQRRKSREYQVKMKSSNPAEYLLKRIKTRAAQKGIECTLTVDYCSDLGECYYCGNEASGFDRIDSDGGYTAMNTVPACSTCNSMKMVMNQNEFVDRCKQIAKKFGGVDG